MVAGGEPDLTSVELAQFAESEGDLECVSPADYPVETKYAAAAILNGIPTVCGDREYSTGNLLSKSYKLTVSATK